MKHTNSEAHKHFTNWSDDHFNDDYQQLREGTKYLY